MVLRFLIAAFFVVACAPNIKSDVQPQSGLIYPDGARLLLAASNAGVGRLDLFALVGGVKPVTVMPIHTDADVRSFPKYGKTIVLNRFGMDSLYVLGKGKGKILNQLALKKGANPQDVLMLDAKTVVISQRSESNLVVWDLESGKTESRSLADFAFEKGIPDMAMMAEVDGKIWIAVQRLKDRMTPAGFSQVVQWDLKRNRLSAFDLKASNPVTAFKRDARGDLYLGGAGHTGQLDGGIEKLDGRNAGTRLVVTEKALEGDIVDFEIFDDELGVALISKPNTELVTFSVKTGKRGETLASSPDYELVKLQWDRPRKRLYLADRNRTQPKVRVFDTASLKELPPIKLELPVWYMEIEEP